MTFRTDTYHVQRMELALLAAKEYIRLFWWFILPTPLFGILAVAFGSGILQVVGMIAILWPFSLPGRSMLATTKSARLFSGGCYMEADEEEVVFYGEATTPRQLRFKVPLRDIRGIRNSGKYLLLRLSRLGFAPVAISAFEAPEAATGFESLVRRSIESSFSSEPDSAPQQERSPSSQGKPE